MRLCGLDPMLADRYFNAFDSIGKTSCLSYEAPLSIDADGSCGDGLSKSSCRTDSASVLLYDDTMIPMHENKSAFGLDS